jgi:hypothetical protein
MKKIADIVATVREWKNKETGARHKTTMNIGALFVSPAGNQVLKLEALPLVAGPIWASIKPCVRPVMTDAPGGDDDGISSE